MGSAEIVKVNGAAERGVMVREGFGGVEVNKPAETAIASVKAREEARVSAMYLMAERHPRSWDAVRVRLMGHCKRPGFAEVARYRKPVGKKNINGQWVESFAEGLSARFAEVARQEMANTNTETSVVYEDDMLRIVRASVVDLERNTIESRELAIPKITEKRGRQKKNSEEWLPPEGREVIQQRVNSYGEPVYLVRATEDEVIQRQNSAISKATRDASLRLIPKDVRDDCEREVLETLNDPTKTDPLLARKRIIDAFAGIGVLPGDLEQYLAGPLDRISPSQLDELRGLYNAIHSGECSFNEAMRTKLDTNAEGLAETTEQRDARLQRAMDAQAQRLKAEEKPSKQEAAAPPTDEPPLPDAWQPQAETDGLSESNFKTALAAYITKDAKKTFDVFHSLGYDSLQDMPKTPQARLLVIDRLESEFMSYLAASQTRARKGKP